MNNLFVYLEIENNAVEEVSLELLTKGRCLAQELQCGLEAVAICADASLIADAVAPYGVERLHIFEDARLAHYMTKPFGAIVTKLFAEEKPQIALMGATSVGRDLGPLVSSALHSGLTADCTSLEIGSYTDPKSKKEYPQLLYQIRPAFGGNIVATIVNPDCRPQMATVRPGVMKKEPLKEYDASKLEVIRHKVSDYISDEDFVVEILERNIEARKVNLGAASVIVAGGYGVGSRENFQLLYQLAETLGAEVGASRAAVDAGFIDHDRQIGQTGVTVRPKLYIACGISGQIQHVAGMQDSSIVISINSDPEAPINSIADYVIIGRIEEVVPRLIAAYKKNSK